MVKNMWFIPFSLLSGLFYSAISLVKLVISSIEANRPLRRRIRFVRPLAIAVIISVPLALSNGIVDSAGYRDAFRSQGRQPVLVASVFDWAMTSQAMLYNLTKPLLRAE